MKKTSKISLTVFLSFLIVYFNSCTEESPTKSQNGQIKFSSYQISGCNKSDLLEKVSETDSCFTYSFDDTLNIDFCVTGNCCPDSNRYAVSYNINSDTIFVEVADTAANLCHCLCNYQIHLELIGLQKEQYLFYCNYDGIITYKEYVNKSNKY